MVSFRCIISYLVKTQQCINDVRFGRIWFSIKCQPNLCSLYTWFTTQIIAMYIVSQICVQHKNNVMSWRFSVVPPVRYGSELNLRSSGGTFHLVENWNLSLGTICHCFHAQSKRLDTWPYPICSKDHKLRLAVYDLMQALKAIVDSVKDKIRQSDRSFCRPILLSDFAFQSLRRQCQDRFGSQSLEAGNLILWRSVVKEPRGQQVSPQLGIGLNQYYRRKKPC